MRLYECDSTCKVYEFPDQHCVFCKHCTDLLYDYTNGPYMFMCELDDVYDQGSACEGFEDDGYVFDEEDYKRRMMEVRGLTEMLSEDESIRKQWEIFINRFNAIGNPNPVSSDVLRSVLNKYLKED